MWCDAFIYKHSTHLVKWLASNKLPTFVVDFLVIVVCLLNGMVILAKMKCYQGKVMNFFYHLKLISQ